MHGARVYSCVGAALQLLHGVRDAFGERPRKRLRCGRRPWQMWVGGDCQSARPRASGCASYLLSHDQALEDQARAREKMDAR